MHWHRLLEQLEFPWKGGSQGRLTREHQVRG
jgi:hypothetical protein